MKKYVLFMSAVLTAVSSLFAQPVLPKIFSDNMVLQRNTQIPVWGKASANEKITVSFNRQTKNTIADKNGKWMLKLDAEKAGGPFELSVKGKTSLLYKNVLVGEVWLCSGQSNMEFTVGSAANSKAEIAVANFPKIRQITVAKDVNTLPLSDFKAGSWVVCDPSTVAAFTAVGYFFARNIYKEINVPIGIMNINWGGTNIETWISREAFESSDEFKQMIAGMPLLDMDSLATMKNKATMQRIEILQGAPVKMKDDPAFTQLSFDDATWPEMNEPQGWEQQALGDLDGVVWLRKTITLSAADAGKAATIQLSKIDDDDVTYVNGIKVGSTNQWDAQRKYTIPAGVLKEGKNTIAIRVNDTGGGGGIYGEASDLKLTTASAVLPLTGAWKYQVESIRSEMNVNGMPSLAYNAMINPVIPYAFKGVLWYQGESNADRAYQYRTAFPLMINDWRKKWNKDFPFYFVQLATFRTYGNSNTGSPWAELREAQTMTLQMPNTGMAVTTDIGNPDDIHPTNKQDVGKRLAAIALDKLYGKKRVSSGPVFQSLSVQKNEALVSFNNTGTGLTTKDNTSELKGFEIAGRDQVFYEATAQIRDNQVVVSSDKVKAPVAVRFGWLGDASANNLFNKEGFPAVPFRTDDWKTVTKNVVYKIEKL